MALFEDLAKIDILSPVAELLDRGAVIHTLDGKLKLTGERGFKTGSPWLDIKFAKDRICGLWHAIYFDQYGFISRNCFHCWKVVVRPKTLKQLFALYELMLKMDLPSKCGIERRQGSLHKGIYAGFWYVPMEGGLKGAKEFYRMISLKVKDKLGFQVPVILKRA